MAERAFGAQPAGEVACPHEEQHQGNQGNCAAEKDDLPQRH
eukprot:CAMPEP_0184426338 /NCGR_PEP_ID=MMETSP0738-20130409/151258_1 /TAXON_ID=385413 /ORGANISM="Thalassiosira miniscula, Strain CCMP1093" /LENGTH=40 /DNA_ID= /DNA_START= /DNA_END= /DNA_ORIENTATION=